MPTARRTARTAPARGRTTGRSARRAAARRRTILVGSVGGCLVLIGAMFAFYFPTRTWLSQRRQTSSAAGQLAKLQSANKQLAANVKSLNDPATVERIARGEYNMVRPGEKAYVVLPPSAGPTTLPQVWPFATG